MYFRGVFSECDECSFLLGKHVTWPGQFSAFVSLSFGLWLVVASSDWPLKGWRSVYVQRSVLDQPRLKQLPFSVQRWCRTWKHCHASCWIAWGHFGLIKDVQCCIAGTCSTWRIQWQPLRTKQHTRSSNAGPMFSFWRGTEKQRDSGNDGAVDAMSATSMFAVQRPVCCIEIGTLVGPVLPFVLAYVWSSCCEWLGLPRRRPIEMLHLCTAGQFNI